MQPSRLIPFFLILATLSLAGFGCKKPVSVRSLPSIAENAYPAAVGLNAQAITQPQVPAPPSAKQPTPISPEIAYLQQVLQNFAQVNSFRAKMQIPTPDGVANGDVEFSKQQGMHGILRLPNAVTAEITIANPDQIFFRSSTTTWTNLSGTDAGAQTAALFQSAFSVNGTSTESEISQSAKLMTISNDPEGCTLYTVDQSKVVAPQILEVCVKNNLPIRLAAHTDDGLVEVRYRDFNQPIEIKVPSVTK